MKSMEVLLTGFPSNELARRVFGRLLDSEPNARLTCLVPERFMEQARARLGRESPERKARVSLLLGDVAHIDMGLSGTELSDLSERVHLIHHCAAVTYSGAPTALAERVNVQGTAEVLELARIAKRLQHVVHWSTTGATWDRDGVVHEDDLIEPQSGKLLKTRFRAERVLRKARNELPITVLRPAMLAGDSHTGELSRIEGASLLISGLINAPREVPVPSPGPSDTPLQLVPIDYAVDAGLAIARAPESVSHTYNIIDPSPPSLREVLTMVALRLGKPPPRGALPPPLARALVRIPLVDRLVHAHRALLDELGRDVRYDDRNARPLLAQAGLRCPPFSSYVEQLIGHVQRERESERPLEPSARFAP